MINFEIWQNKRRWSWINGYVDADDNEHRDSAWCLDVLSDQSGENTLIEIRAQWRTFTVYLNWCHVATRASEDKRWCSKWSERLTGRSIKRYQRQATLTRTIGARLLRRCHGLYHQLPSDPAMVSGTMCWDNCWLASPRITACSIYRHEPVADRRLLLQGELRHPGRLAYWRQRRLPTSSAKQWEFAPAVVWLIPLHCGVRLTDAAQHYLRR